MAGVYAVIVAAGRGTRMGADENKVFLQLAGRSAIWHSVRAFFSHPEVDGVCVVCAASEAERMQEELSGMPGVLLAQGGDTRGESVVSGLMRLPAEAEIALIHDGARPLVGSATIADCIASVRRYGSGVVCAPMHDTVKVQEDGVVKETLDRENLRAMQTPQGFYVQELLCGYAQALREGLNLTDDAAVMENRGMEVRLVENAAPNFKLTTPADLALARLIVSGTPRVRCGMGYDVHRLVPGRALVLCGVTIPHELGLDGHSDADVAIHALMDAMLGAAGLGDIGRLFPDTDETYKGISSVLLLREVVRRMEPLRVQHADVTIICQRPKLAPYMDAMCKTLAAELPGATVNVKATTTEHLGFEGRQEGISAQAVVTVC